MRLIHFRYVAFSLALSSFVPVPAVAATERSFWSCLSRFVFLYDETRAADRRFIATLHARGALAARYDERLGPVLLRAEGPVPFPRYEGDTPDIVFGSGDLSAFVHAQQALTRRTWEAAPIPAEFRPLFEFPTSAVDRIYDLARRMDFTVASGRSIHFRLEGLDGDWPAEDARWALERALHGLENGFYRPGTIVFWRNGATVAR